MYGLHLMANPLWPRSSSIMNRGMTPITLQPKQTDVSERVISPRFCPCGSSLETRAGPLALSRCHSCRRSREASISVNWLWRSVTTPTAVVTSCQSQGAGSGTGCSQLMTDDHHAFVSTEQRGYRVMEADSRGHWPKQKIGNEQK